MGSAIRPQRWWVAGGIGAGVIWTVAKLTVPLLAAAAIDQGIRKGDTGTVVALTLVMVAVGVVQAVATGLRRYAAFRIALRTETDLRQRLFAHLQRLHFAFHDQAQTGQLMARANTDIQQVETVVILIPLTAASCLTMVGVLVIMAFLEVGGFFEWAAAHIVARAHSARALLGTVVVASGLLSAFFVNDTVCLVLTPLVLAAVRPLGLAPLPFLLAVALGSNAGSAMTPTGNPQNMLIAVASGISFARFVGTLALPSLGGLAIVFGVIALFWGAHKTGRMTIDTVASPKVSWVHDIDWFNITKIGAVLLFVFVVMAMSNAVNLTDGLDGLATGTSILVIGSYMAIAFWQYRHWCADMSYKASYCYDVRDPLEMALISGAAAGALVGFLWWNTSPARIFMGDTGSMALGSLIAGLAMATKTILLLPLLGLLFFIIVVTWVMQIGSYKLTGKRIFRMVPLQHHFELAGWSEVNIVVRFWIVAGLGMAASLGIFAADFLRVMSGTS